MKEIKKFRIYLVVSLIFILIFVQIFNINLNNSLNQREPDSLPIQAGTTFTKEWIKNGNFSSQQHWYPSILGDESDVNVSISNEQANFVILGDKGDFKLNETPSASNWQNFTNSDRPVVPDTDKIDEYGIFVYHSWRENVNPLEYYTSIHYKQNFTMPVDMSDYKITSASFQAVVNATVTEGAVVKGIEAGADLNDTIIDQWVTGDYVRFYVLVSDVENSNSYCIGEYQPVDLGEGMTGGQLDYLNDTFIMPIPEEVLIFYLTSVLSIDNYNFTITLGIDIHSEDNHAGDDEDIWNELRIKNISLNFTYEKKINQFTRVAWNQNGDKPDDVTNNTIIINNAMLNFEYNINDTWPELLSPNSEIRILINNFQHPETIKLSTATPILQEAKSGGFEVTSLIQKENNVNLSLQVYLADEFALNRSIMISIDNVSLNITYTEDIAALPSSYQLFLNSNDKTNDSVISLPLGENLNITLKYTDNQTKAHLSNATVQLEGKVNKDFFENFTLQQYTAIVNTSDIGIGVSILTIVADKDYYETQNIPFFVEVTEKATELQLFLNNVPKNDSDSIEVEIDDTINVSVQYRDYLTGKPIRNATVKLLGLEDLNETNDYYNIKLNASDLGQGITAFTIFAQKINYQPQSIHFFVQVSERSTYLQLFINNEDKTIDPIFNLVIDTMLNITLKYYDNKTGTPISNASIQLIGEGLSDEFIKDFSGDQYYYLTNSTNLKLGVNLFTIIAQAENYQILTIYLRIVVNRINGIINTTSQISGEEGDDIIVNIKLINSDLGGLIRNATVTYSWAYGQGQFVYLENEEIYQAIFTNVPEGVYSVTISAYVGDEYSIESREITLIVTEPTKEAGIDWSWLIYILSGVIVGLVAIFSVYQKYYKYPPLIRKTRKLRKNIRKDKKVKPVELKNRDDIVNTFYKENYRIAELEPTLNLKRDKLEKKE